MGGPRPLSAVRVDARRPLDRDLGRGQDLEGRRRDRQGHADSVHGARRADDQRRGALPAEGAPGRVPGADAARRARRRPTASRSSTARSASSTCGRCPTASRAGCTERTIALEFFPSFSRDGQWIVYTTWTDAETRPRARRSARRRRPAATSCARQVTTSSRRSRRTARRSSSARSAAIRRAARTSASDAGIYVVPAAGGEPGWCATRAASPEFDHTGTRIYFRELRNEQFTLLSVGVPAPTRRCRAATRSSTSAVDNATQIVPSPDGKWIAFEERFRTLRRAVPAHRPPDRHRSGDAGLPGRSASRATPASTCTGRATAAGCTGRSGRSCSRATSPTRSRSRAGGATGGRTRTPAPSRRRRASPSASRAKSDVPTGSLALVGARVITMAGLKPGPIAGTPGVIENGTVVVDGNRIVAVGPAARVQVPAGAPAHRRQGQDDHAGHHRRARARRRRVERPAGAIQLAAGRQPRLRRDHVARSVERHRDGVHERRADSRRRASSGRACSRPARSSTARRRPSRRSSRPTTTRCRTCAGRRRSARSPSRATTSSGATRGR